MRNPDRLFHLLPAVYRARDEALATGGEGGPLRAILRVLGEQLDAVDAETEQLYRNWFIETCDDWAVPYIGALVGYAPVAEAGTPVDPHTERGSRLDRALVPRREVARTIALRRRKGTLALLEELGRDVADWPSRAVECYRLLLFCQHVNFLRPHRGRSVDVRDGTALAALGTPFEGTARSLDVRSVASARTRGRGNLRGVKLFVWRLSDVTVTRTQAYLHEDAGEGCYSFSPLGVDAPLFIRPEPEADPTHIARRENLPTPIGRRQLQDDLRRPAPTLPGPDASFAVWATPADVVVAPRATDATVGRFVAADLSD